MAGLPSYRGGQQQHGSPALSSVSPPRLRARRSALPQSQVEQEPIAHRVAEVERLFWLCDYVATTRGVDSTPVDVCSAATEELKNAKFGGDFMALLEWWRGNKPEEHARLAHLTTQPVTSGPREDGLTAHATAF